ncbi:MAG TPA: AI-2E family transporter [Acidimicrobiia bacterium]|jgi:predicted PurR-regulated permease PerM|nr:AI-2E family transporter [Acidimicrobiia bacterium]
MADGRRSDGHDAELLRAVFVILSGVLAFSVGVLLFWELRRIVALIVIAAFFATILNPMVDALTRLRIRRGIATSIVFLLGVAAFAGLIYTFVRPIYDSGQSFARDIPGFVKRAKTGEGRVGELIKRYNIDEKVAENAPKLQDALKNAGGPAVRTAQRVASGLLALLTIAVLSFLMLLEAPGIISTFLGLLSPQRALQVRRIGADVAGAVTGYMAGNLLISLIAGLTTWIFLTIVGVPFAGVLGLWVGFADLLPLVGATIGAIPTIAIAFLHSTGAGIAVLIMYIVYQQIENHLLQPVVMSRTVKLNPLGVLLSALVGVELAGFVGALLAIPAAGAIQVVIRDLWDERLQRLKSVPTVGVDETPITGVPILPPPPEDPRATGTA